MRILIVGGGGREHALAWKLAQEVEVFAAPGNPGMAEECDTFPTSASDHQGRAELARRLQADLVLVGPEDPLIAGIGDRLRGAGIHVFGPGADGAQLEGSKAFSKELMREAGVPTARFQSFRESGPAKTFARKLSEDGAGVVVKASGAALGKGAIVCAAVEEAEDAIDMMLTRRELGPAGDTIVLEERLDGPEFSLLTLANESGFVSLPVAQDYKRIGVGDTGPNTGGMGSYSPVPWVTPDLVSRAEERVVAPMLRLLGMKGIAFRGVLFSGLMLHGGVPHCLEYNVRFGDPETQSIMMRLGAGFAESLYRAARGEPIEPPAVLHDAAVTVVAASAGYPGPYERGKPIAVGALPQNAKVFHAGTTRAGMELLTNGGRVLAVTARGPTVEAARATAYEGLAAISFEGMQFRTDIGL